MWALDYENFKIYLKYKADNICHSDTFSIASF